MNSNNGLPAYSKPQRKTNMNKKNNKPERYLPSPEEMLEMFTIKKNTVNSVVPTKDPNVIVRTRPMNDVTPKRRKTW